MAPYLVALLVVLVGIGALAGVLLVTRRLGAPREPAVPTPEPVHPVHVASDYVAPHREGLPLVAAVERLADTSPVPLVVALAGLPELPEETTEAAYDAIAVCVENTVQHADAVRAWVRAEQLGPVLRLGIGDDGRGGADPHGPTLAALQKRVTDLGGDAQVHSPEGGPTLVSIELPVPEQPWK